VNPTERRLSIAGEDFHGEDWSIALARTSEGRAVGLIAAGRAGALSGLARKLPHYGKYGYLVFAGDAPDNRVKGQWPPGDSPLRVWLDEARPALAVPDLPALTAALPGGPFSAAAPLAQ
jgi:hypothetical protein